MIILDMDQIQHFSHQHPLNFCQLDGDDDIPYLCGICGLPILLVPSYTCSSGCNFFVHKPCTQLHQSMKSEHARHRHQFDSYRPLFLKEKPHSRKSCNIFTYSCSYCTFDLHPLLAARVEIKSIHHSHKSHPLVAHGREITSLCDACGRAHEGFFFSCQECSFWIHEDCTLLPSAMYCYSHPHLSILSYTFDTSQRRYCHICTTGMFGMGCYMCGPCAFVAHLHCAISEMSERRSELLHLPDEEDKFPSLSIRRRIPEGTKDNNEKLNVEYHNHTLVYEDHFLTSEDGEECSDQELVCNACIQPISPPFYTCPQSGCYFLIHNFCVNPQCDITYLKPGFLLHSSEYFFCSIFYCHFCQRPSNGFCYRSDQILVDIECAYTESAIKHASHKQHVLVLTDITESSPITSMEFNCCYDKSATTVAYMCTSCDFMIHVGCALLPKRVGHKFDKHLLTLISDWNSDLEDCFCEFCEQDIKQQYWFYHCAECKQSFHVECIPSVGYLSKVKFGGSLDICSTQHDHPVTLTRMLIQGNQKCGYCKQTIHGFVDDMAFHCSKCYFWIHFSCARKCAIGAASRLELFSEAFYFRKNTVEQIIEAYHNKVAALIS